MKFIKKERSFTMIRKYGFLFTFLVAIGGLFYPELGLLVLLIMLGLLVTSFFNGKYWCGNICPHGSYFDNIILPISKNKEIPKIFKSKILQLSFFILFLLNLSNKFINILDEFGTMDFWSKLGSIFASTYLMVVIVGGIIGITTSPRTWCQICPMGTMEKISYKTSKLLNIRSKYEEQITMSNVNKCKACNLCYKVCPMQIELISELNSKNQLENINCIKCSTCVNYCPLEILSLEKVNYDK